MNHLIGVEKVRQYVVTERDIVRFAQAIGAGFPKRDAQGLAIAPPLFCQAFMFEDVPASELPEDGSPKELDVPIPAKRTVGGSSDFEFFGVVKSGDSITVRSKLKDVTAKEGKSGALYLVTVETSFSNQSGALVARETATYVKRPYTMMTYDVKPQTSLGQLKIVPTRTQLFSFSAITWNRHKIHFDQTQARLEGFPDVVVQRGLIGNFLALLINDWAGPEARLERLQWKVLKSAFPDQELTCSGLVTEVAERNGAVTALCAVTVRNHEGAELAVGEAKVSLKK